MTSSDLTVNTQIFADTFKYQAVQSANGINAISISNTGNVVFYDPYIQDEGPLSINYKYNTENYLRATYSNTLSFGSNFGIDGNNYTTITPRGVMSFNTSNGVTDAFYLDNFHDYLNEMGMTFVGNVSTTDPFINFYAQDKSGFFTVDSEIWIVNSVGSWWEGYNQNVETFWLEASGGTLAWENPVNYANNSVQAGSISLESGEFFVTNNNTSYNAFRLTPAAGGLQRFTIYGGGIELQDQATALNQWQSEGIFKITYNIGGAVTQNPNNTSLFGTTNHTFIFNSDKHIVNSTPITGTATITSGTDNNSVVNTGIVECYSTILTNGVKIVFGDYTESEEFYNYRSGLAEWDTYGNNTSILSNYFQLPSYATFSNTLNWTCSTNNSIISCAAIPSGNSSLYFRFKKNISANTAVNSRVKVNFLVIGRE